MLGGGKLPSLGNGAPYRLNVGQCDSPVPDILVDVLAGDDGHDVVFTHINFKGVVICAWSEEDLNPEAMRGLEGNCLSCHGQVTQVSVQFRQSDPYLVFVEAKDDLSEVVQFVLLLEHLQGILVEKGRQGRPLPHLMIRVEVGESEDIHKRMDVRL